MIITIIVLVACLLFLSVSLYSVGRYKYKRKTSRPPPARAMRRWGHHDSTSGTALILQSYHSLALSYQIQKLRVMSMSTMEQSIKLRKTLHYAYQLCVS